MTTSQAVSRSHHEGKLNPAEPSNLSKMEISRMAELFSTTVEFSPGGELTPVVHQLGGKIEFLDWEKWSQRGADSVQVYGHRDFTIFLSKIGGLFNNRFSIAHELGHYFLHSKMGEKKIVAHRNRENSRVEWEANWFAGSLLMPEAHFREAAQHRPDPHALAAIYLVSPTAIIVRKKTLGIQ